LERNARPTKVWQGDYEPVRAYGLALRRRCWDGRFKLVRQPDLREMVKDRLAMGWSPEQIASRTPRKCLDFQTPAEAFSKIKSSVALQT